MDLKEVIQSVGIKNTSLQSERVIKVSQEVTQSTKASGNVAIKALLAAKYDTYWSLTSVPLIQKCGSYYCIYSSKRKLVNNYKNNSKRKYGSIHKIKYDAERESYLSLGSVMKVKQVKI